MPEQPDVDLYVHHVARRVKGRRLLRVRVATPFVLRTFDPPVRALEGRTVEGVHRLGKRIVLDLDQDLHAVIHLMIAGRLQWKDESGAPPPKKIGLAAFDFESGTLLFTEASAKKRASLHVVRGAALREIDPGGVDPRAMTEGAFAEALRRENHTLKRTLTDPRVLSGIGNAYSDEILHHARLSPVRLTQQATDEELARLHASIKVVLDAWTERLCAQAGDEFPAKVTAFRPEMAVHGKYGEPCPRCGAPVQRIRYASNEANYCAPCQTGGKLLADRGLSRLLGRDWPKTLEELEERKRAPT
jgi:formamidopyrimidine-DNA glycosylase